MTDTIYAVTEEGSSDIGDIFLGTSEQLSNCFGAVYATNLKELQYVAEKMFKPTKVVVTIVE